MSKLQEQCWHPRVADGQCERCGKTGLPDGAYELIKPAGESDLESLDRKKKPVGKLVNWR